MMVCKVRRNIIRYFEMSVFRYVDVPPRGGPLGPLRSPESTGPGRGSRPPSCRRRCCRPSSSPCRRRRCRPSPSPLAKAFCPPGQCVSGPWAWPLSSYWLDPGRSYCPCKEVESRVPANGRIGPRVALVPPGGAWVWASRCDNHWSPIGSGSCIPPAAPLWGGGEGVLTNGWHWWGSRAGVTHPAPAVAPLGEIPEVCNAHGPGLRNPSIIINPLNTDQY